MAKAFDRQRIDIVKHSDGRYWIRKDNKTVANGKGFIDKVELAGDLRARCQVSASKMYDILSLADVEAVSHPQYVGPLA